MAFFCRLTIVLLSIDIWDPQEYFRTCNGNVIIEYDSNVVNPSPFPQPDPIEYCEHFDIEEIKKSAPWVPAVVVCDCPFIPPSPLITFLSFSGYLSLVFSFSTQQHRQASSIFACIQCSFYVLERFSS